MMGRNAGAYELSETTLLILDTSYWPAGAYAYIISQNGKPLMKKGKIVVVHYKPALFEIVRLERFKREYKVSQRAQRNRATAGRTQSLNAAFLCVLFVFLNFSVLSVIIGCLLPIFRQ